MKKSLFAKLVIVMLCLSLVLCGCGKDNAAGNDNTQQEGTPTTSTNTNAPTPEQVADESLGNTLEAIFGQELDFGATTKTTVSIEGVGNNALYVNTDQLMLVDALSINCMGIELDVCLYLDGNNLVLTMPGAIQGAYGIRFDTLTQDMENSDIWTVLGVSYDQFMEAVMPAIDEIVGTEDSAGIDFSGLETSVEDALENVEKKTTEGKVTVDGKEVDAVIVTYSMDAETMGELLKAVTGWMADNIDRLEASTDAVDVSQIVDSLKTSLNEIIETANPSAELVVNINASTGSIMTLEGAINYTVEDEDCSLTMDMNFGVDAAKSDTYTMNIAAEANGNVVQILQMRLKSTVAATCASYNITFGTEILTGNLEEITLVITVEKIAASDIPQLPEYKNIFKLTENEIYNLMTELQGVFGEESFDEPSDNMDDVSFGEL